MEEGGYEELLIFQGAGKIGRHLGLRLARIELVEPAEDLGVAGPAVEQIAVETSDKLGVRGSLAVVVFGRRQHLVDQIADVAGRSEEGQAGTQFPRRGLPAKELLVDI